MSIYYCETHLGQSSLGMVNQVRLECGGDRGVHVVAGGRRVSGDGGSVGGSRFDAVDGDVAVSPSSDAAAAAAAVRIGYIIVVNSGRNFEPG